MSKVPSPSSLPTTLTKRIPTDKIETPTDVLVTIFSDRIQILISQKSGKIGSMLSCNHEYSQIDNSHTFQVSNLLGKREDALPSVYARQILEQIVYLGDGMSNCPPLLLGITLEDKDGKGSSQEEFKIIVSEVISLYKYAVQTISSS
uniref:Proteasome assembly chaperone 3 n=1 Tax=Chaetoceros debilis TaxID=122233 RepID=A0A7S3PYV0_9STRA|mmetsp:Transcript_10229/g.15440  ORF Transcript_10229/g.15440 Transcript_10229/m.15440 type:complete len:147 (-) Transcript_10229:181-621(-)|eukprot:CAMPEP_0194091072 /NCGR_PEP_ID=MMETSP0149-20130528/41451_1 /TAXON_ID=122233 /ORGANISM="Chaetoceros debilis, Strain MM31A-1" /LENGTH=146 /DNA_ID=CAMNT_0038775531 /DNA_START=114 /DNA_END=554 /DNA_ORIENTATION=+